MSASIHYHMNDATIASLFDYNFQQVIASLANVAGDKSAIDVFADAVLKTNRIPTGVAITSTTKDARLFPQLLRDPGCGFLCFELTWNEPPQNNWQNEVGEFLNTVLINNDCSQTLQSYQLIDNNLENILNQGLWAIESIAEHNFDKFNHLRFKVDSKNWDLTDEEIQLLHHDFLTLTNTIEIREPYSINTSKNLNKEFHGFIHCGSLKFPSILAKRFIEPIYHYSIHDSSFRNEDIDNGLYAVAHDTKLGQHYANWIHAAMNYALVNRYALFCEIKFLLEQNFPCQVDMKHDQIHAGLLADENCIIQIRGTQPVNKHRTALIAGQRESIAANVNTKKSGFLPHGTGEDKDHLKNNKALLTDYEIEIFHNKAKHAYYNTIPDINACIPYSAVLKKNLDWFINQEIISVNQLLLPMINLQSRWLQSFDKTKSVSN